VDGISGDVTKSRSDNDLSEPAPVLPTIQGQDCFDEPGEASAMPSLKPRAPPRKPAPAKLAPNAKRFANEPSEPSLDLKTQIATIEQYISDFKNVLGLIGNDSVEKLLTATADKVTRQFARDGTKTKVGTLAQKIALIKLLDAECKNIADAQTERQKDFDELAHKKELFSPIGDTVVNVCVNERGKEPVNASVRFFDNPLDLAKENKKRSSLGLSPLPETFLKSTMVNYLGAELASSQAALTKLSLRAQELKSRLSELEKEKSGDLALNLDAVKAFNAKIVILKKWESALQKRKKAPSEAVVPQKRQESKALQKDPLDSSQAFRIGQRSPEGLARFIV